jgi:L-seryl-tRNA(Ser) seleniumtransferase
METVPSAGLAIRPRAAKHSGRLLTALSMALRRLPVPVVGRIEDKALLLDLRCLDDEESFIANLATLNVAEDTDALA